MAVLSLQRLSPIARAVAVIGATAGLVTGVTFAALNSQATLANNTIGTTSASANLLLWDGDSFESTAQGFNFSELVPGTPSDPFSFYFKNAGNTDLDVTASVADALTFSEGLTAADVSLTFKGSCDDAPVTATLAELNAPDAAVELPCGPLETGAQGVIGENDNNANYTVTVKVADSVNLGENPLTVSPFDIVFDGTVVTTPGV